MVCKVYRNEAIKREKKKCTFSGHHLPPQPTELKTGVGPENVASQALWATLTCTHI